jgi:hypothetical protein
MGVEIDRSEVDGLFEELEYVGSRSIEYLALDFWSISVEEAPIAKGTLRGSIQADQKDDLSWIVGTNLEYAVPVHEGYPPFWLDSPVNIDGNWVYIKEHPGYSGNPFFDRTIDSLEGKIDTYLDLAIADLQYK